MSDLVEKIAQAMREKVRPYQRQTPGEYGATSNLEWNEMPEVHQRPFRMMARAAIEEMKNHRPAPLTRVKGQPRPRGAGSE